MPQPLARLTHSSPHDAALVCYTRREEGVVISCAGEGGAAGEDAPGAEGEGGEGAVAVGLYDRERRGLPPTG